MIIANGFQEHVIALGFTEISPARGAHWRYERWSNMNSRHTGVSPPKHFFQVTRGKYSGSIGWFKNGHLLIGDRDSCVTIPLLSPKSMKFLPDHNGTTKLVAKPGKPQYDIYCDIVITPGMYVMFPSGDYIHVGHVINFDPVSNQFRVATKFNIQLVSSRRMTVIPDDDYVVSEKHKITISMLQRTA